MKKGYLALENGKVFSGYFVTDIENAAGEAVFTTGVVGYNNVLCDPCNIGQIVIQTFPLAGACGICSTLKIPCDFHPESIALT